MFVSDSSLAYKQARTVGRLCKRIMRSRVKWQVMQFVVVSLLHQDCFFSFLQYLELWYSSILNYSRSVPGAHTICCSCTTTAHAIKKQILFTVFFCKIDCLSIPKYVYFFYHILSVADNQYGPKKEYSLQMTLDL